MVAVLVGSQPNATQGPAIMGIKLRELTWTGWILAVLAMGVGEEPEARTFGVDVPEVSHVDVNQQPS